MKHGTLMSSDRSSPKLVCKQQQITSGYVSHTRFNHHARDIPTLLCNTIRNHVTSHVHAVELFEVLKTVKSLYND